MTVFVCRSCRDADDPSIDPRPGLLLAQAVIDKAQGSHIAVRSVSCLANCKRGSSAAIRRKSGWSYVFGGLKPEDAADIVTGAEIFSRSEDGLMPWRGRPDSLKRGMIARIPPFDFIEEK